MDNLDDNFQVNEKLGFSPKLKSRLKSIRVWAVISGDLLLVSGSIGLIFSAFLFYETLVNTPSFRFEENLFGSILVLSASIFVFVIGFLLNRFGVDLKKGFNNQDQIMIERGFKRIRIVIIMLSILVILAAASLLFFCVVFMIFALPNIV